jgi:hypothetical protein
LGLERVGRHCRWWHPSTAGGGTLALPVVTPRHFRSRSGGTAGAGGVKVTSPGEVRATASFFPRAPLLPPIAPAAADAAPAQKSPSRVLPRPLVGRAWAGHPPPWLPPPVSFCSFSLPLYVGLTCLEDKWLEDLLRIDYHWCRRSIALL